MARYGNEAVRVENPRHDTTAFASLQLSPAYLTNSRSYQKNAKTSSPPSHACLQNTPPPTTNTLPCRTSHPACRPQERPNVCTAVGADQVPSACLATHSPVPASAAYRKPACACLGLGLGRRSGGGRCGAIDIDTVGVVRWANKDFKSQETTADGGI